MSRLFKVGKWILIVIAIFIIYLVGINFWEANFAEKSTSLTNVTYAADDGTQLIGYLAKPKEPGPHPGILLIHEWWGLNEGITILADALSKQGYIVLAADAYRGQVTDKIPRTITLIRTTPEEQIFSDLDAGLSYLYNLVEVDTSRIATMGFCFGGGHSLQLGLRESERISNTILFYGAVVTNPELLRPLINSSGVLGIFAEDDQSIFPGDVLEFEAALDSLNIPNEITIYDGVGHGFVDEENYNQPGTAMDAWQQMLVYLESNLKE
ncbi:MAG: dienelactone hydrolase family protein [Anaerolineae bacterium]|nr:dienelactone hydrolase family protein [Anaerolineae bacterium]